MSVLKINNIEMPCPSSLSWTLQTFDLDSGRSAVTGELQRQVICSKEALDLSWNSANLSTQEIAKLLQAVNSPFFSVTYFSPLSGSTVTKTMYVGDRNISIYSIIDGKPVMDEISFTLIEK